MNFRLSVMMFLQFFTWGAWFLRRWLPHSMPISWSESRERLRVSSYCRNLRSVVSGLIADRLFL